MLAASLIIVLFFPPSSSSSSLLHVVFSKLPYSLWSLQAGGVDVTFLTDGAAVAGLLTRKRGERGFLLLAKRNKVYH